jgi:hypothetical protein
MFDNLWCMRRVHVPIHDGRPRGAVHGGDQSWKIHAVRGHWNHPAPLTAEPGEETTRWRFLVEGPALYRIGDEGFFEVVVRGFAAGDSWWMDTA